MTAPRRILHYNWAQFDDPEFRGGGVSVYLRNLLDRLAGDPGYEFTVLSAGHHYTYTNRKPRYEPTPNILSDRGVKTFRILNSPVKAPAHDMFYDIGLWRSDPEVAKVFAQVLTAQGPFDDVVLHSMEGISSEVLALREKFPQTRFHYMWHNYMPLCPQIELLHQNRFDCMDYEDGRKCQGCLAGFHSRDQLIAPQRFGTSLEFARLSGRPLGNFLFGLGIGSFKIAQATGYFLKDLRRSVRGAFSRDDGSAPRGRGFQSVDLAAEGPGPAGRPLAPVARKAGEYRAWRELNLALLNRFDSHMCVSQLVADTITRLGMLPQKVQVTPLGMDLHATPAQMRARAAAKPRRDRMRISFIGYGIPSKGLPFITEALMKADLPVLKEKAELVIYARLGDHELCKLTPLTERFADVRVVQGYERKDLARIASDIDLNIVPSIWRETYNQVAYELLCLGTPSLLSTTVGLGMFWDRHPEFVFRSGSHEDFVARLGRIVAEPRLLEAFWTNPPELPTMDQHIATALAAMQGGKRNEAA
ncbi:glycosyltransferase family protein [Mangrovicoccus algicola]|uniref:Glycosyltransferase n=1 Tax=Mangrovicoccus algicola TaxID=2771008 RepID=A0A8J7CYY5_9RHOB|nr:glycosyltransferase [Mangrovicoccus algicola]MBE3640152.1 glycosyltransferase [Mangrovicoccus algicola]